MTDHAQLIPSLAQVETMLELAGFYVDLSGGRSGEENQAFLDEVNLAIQGNYTNVMDRVMRL